MNFSKRNKSIVDIMFIIALFGAFAITGLFVVLFGARVYQSTVANMDANYSSRTALSYVTEKIRSHDFASGTEYESIEIGDNNGQSVLILRENVEGRTFATYMYVDEGYLKEFTADEEYDFDYDKGTSIIRVEKFAITNVTDNLYYVDIVDEYGNSTKFYVSTYSDKNIKE